MLSQVLNGLTLVRHAVAITLVMGAAGATVAGAVDVSHTTTATSAVVSTTATTKQNDNTDLEAAVKACLGTKDPDSDECVKAVELSGVPADVFWAKVAFSLNEQLGRAKNEKHDEKTEPTAKPHQDVNTHELFGLVTACVASHERSSEPCAKALELSGLSADDFWAKVGAMFENKKTEPSQSPKTEGVTALIGACLKLFEAAKNGTYTEPITTSEACKKAFEASGLTPEQFYAKFVQKTTATPKPTETPRRTEQPKPSATPKPQATQSVSDADLIVMVHDCFTKYLAATAAKGNEDLGRAAYEACTSAIKASGLSNDAFWAKFGTPQAPKI